MEETRLDQTVSIAVLTYHPNREKLMKTVRSVLQQKDVRYQIVVSDDCSEEPYFAELEELFAQYGFTDYQLVRNQKNQGTVKNCLAAVEVCTGAYVKLISPGDYFATENALAEWLAFLMREKKDWSFCDAVYYRLNEQGKTDILEEPAHPQMVSPYLGTCTARKEARRRWNYVVLRDICLGAATLCRRELLLQYFQEIAGEIIYTEDTIYRLMAFDGKTACYFPESIIMYEYGTGISTSGNDLWSKRIKADWDKTTQMLMSRCDSSKTGRKYRRSILLMDRSNGMPKKLLKLFVRGFPRFKMQLLFFERKTKGA